MQDILDVLKVTGSHDFHHVQSIPDTPCVLNGHGSTENGDIYENNLTRTLHETSQSLEHQVHRWDLIQDLMKDWLKFGSITCSKRELDDFYVCLVDLNILAGSTKRIDLEYAVFLVFQAINHEEIDGLPNFPQVVKAFHFLVVDAPLCQWIVLLYAHQWSTESEGNWNKFCQGYDLKTFDNQEAVGKLVYGIAQVRCQFTPGTENAVLRHWCSVHSHAPNDAEWRLCEKRRKEINHDIEAAMQAERERELD